MLGYEKNQPLQDRPPHTKGQSIISKYKAEVIILWESDWGRNIDPQAMTDIKVSLDQFLKLEVR